MLRAQYSESYACAQAGKGRLSAYWETPLLSRKYHLWVGIGNSPLLIITMFAPDTTKQPRLREMGIGCCSKGRTQPACLLACLACLPACDLTMLAVPERTTIEGEP